MRNIWINAIQFDPSGVESVDRFVTPDFIRGYSNSCPSGTGRDGGAQSERRQTSGVVCS
jgi:hypothetical protein